MTNSFTDNDKGYSDLKTSLDTLNGSAVTVGVHGEEKARDDDTPLNNAEIAAKNEFGWEHIPERSFLRSTVSENREEYFSTFVELVADRLPRADFASDAGKIGAVMSGDVKKKIRDLKKPPNSPITIARKSKNGNISDNPLIDTGQLRRAIDFEVNL